MRKAASPVSARPITGSKVLKPVGRILPWIGSGGSAFGGFAMLCCFGWTGLASLLPLLGLGVLVRFNNALRLVWIALAILGVGLLVSFIRHRRPWPFATATLGAGLAVYPMYHALEVSLWLGLVYSGLAFLFASAAMDLWLALRASPRWCRPRAPQGSGGATPAQTALFPAALPGAQP